jgi:hypothetical protein
VWRGRNVMERYFPNTKQMCWFLYTATLSHASGDLWLQTIGRMIIARGKPKLKSNYFALIPVKCWVKPQLRTAIVICSRACSTQEGHDRCVWMEVRWTIIGKSKQYEWEETLFSGICFWRRCYSCCRGIELGLEVGVWPPKFYVRGCI